MTSAELLEFLFDAGDTDTTLAGWIVASRRFQSFAADYRTKIRKKLRLAATPQNRRSLLLELDVARRLVEDTRCAVAYEALGQGAERTPDLTVTFRANTIVHLEATSLRSAQAEKLIRVVHDKRGQTMPRTINVLVVAAEEGALTGEELDGALKTLRLRVERRESGYDAPAEFHKAFQWLSGIVLRQPGETLLWTNPQARRPLPAELQTLLKVRLAPEEPACPPA